MLNEKIKQIIIQKNYSPSHFADEIGIQRSSISHILAGRNKPSFDIIQKIIKRFPELGYEWIMDDKMMPLLAVNMPETVSENREITSSKRGPKPRNYENIIPRDFHRNFSTDGLPVQPTQIREQQTPITEALPNASDNRKIEKILIFYSDKTFTEYNPY